MTDSLTSRLTPKVLRKAIDVYYSERRSNASLVSLERAEEVAMQAAIVAALGPLVEPRPTREQVNTAFGTLSRHTVHCGDCHDTRCYGNPTYDMVLDLLEARGWFAAAPLVSPPGERTPPTCATCHEAHGYLSRLFKWVWPQCEPLPTLMGVCTQIDNGLVGFLTERSESAWRLKGLKGRETETTNEAPPAAPPPAETAKVVIGAGAMAGLIDTLGGKSGATVVELGHHEVNDIAMSGQAYSLDGKFNIRDETGKIRDWYVRATGDNWPAAEAPAETQPVELTDEMIGQMMEEAQKAYIEARSASLVMERGDFKRAREFGTAASYETIRSYLYQAGILHEPATRSKP